MPNSALRWADPESPAIALTDIGIRARRMIRDIVTLKPCKDHGASFGLIQGRYRNSRRAVDGVELLRSHSIFDGPDDDVLRVGIGRQPTLL